MKRPVQLLIAGVSLVCGCASNDQPASIAVRGGPTDVEDRAAQIASRRLPDDSQVDLENDPSAREIEPEFVFENRPEFGIPPEAVSRVGEITDKKLSDVLGPSLKTVVVRYFDDEVWSDQWQVEEYLAGLFKDSESKAWTWQIWSGGIGGYPEIECHLEFDFEFDQFRHGRLLVWGGYACLRDAGGRWWFISTFDYYHRNHPKGDRSLAKKPKPMSLREDQSDDASMNRLNTNNQQ